MHRNTNAAGMLGILGGMGPMAGAAFALRLAALTPADRDQDHIPALLLNDPRVPDRSTARLGGGEGTAQLGGSALLGSRVWSRQHKFRIVFGPLTLAEYERLLPGGLSFHRLVPIVRNYAGDALVWDVSLILKREEVPAIRLGRQGRLGWTTWLMPRNAPEDAADLFLDASADSHAAGVNNATH